VFALDINNLLIERRELAGALLGHAFALGRRRRGSGLVVFVCLGALLDMTGNGVGCHTTSNPDHAVNSAEFSNELLVQFLFFFLSLVILFVFFGGLRSAGGGALELEEICSPIAAKLGVHGQVCLSAGFIGGAVGLGSFRGRGDDIVLIFLLFRYGLLSFGCVGFLLGW
jgi:hypothetical protein